MRQGQRFKIIRKLDAGGMAEVYHAELETMEGFRKIVAVKKVLPHLVQNEKFMRMFLDEARLSLRMSHANVVQMFDVGQAGGSFYVIMEFVDGVNLKHVFDFNMARGVVLPIEQSIHVLVEVCKGLQYAHDLTDLDGKALKIVHRDVTPPNILISKQGEVKLVDFGLAKATSQLEHTDPGIIKGKFSYLSPEAAEGHEVDHRADIFAAGIVFFELLTGRRLFLGQNDYETVEQVRTADIPSVSAINPAVPAELERIALRALSRDLSRRYQSAHEMGDDLYQFLFSRGLKVSSFDIAELVKTAVRESAAPRQTAGIMIIDRLIEEELTKLTSIGDTRGLFLGGQKPLSAEEISGAYHGDLASLEDPRTWGVDLDDGAALGLPQADARAAWREVRPTPLPMRVSDMSPRIRKASDAHARKAAAPAAGTKAKTKAQAQDEGPQEAPPPRKSYMPLLAAITAILAALVGLLVYLSLR